MFLLLYCLDNDYINQYHWFLKYSIGVCEYWSFGKKKIFIDSINVLLLAFAVFLVEIIYLFFTLTDPFNVFLTINPLHRTKTIEYISSPVWLGLTKTPAGPFHLKLRDTNSIALQLSEDNKKEGDHGQPLHVQFISLVFFTYNPGCSSIRISSLWSGFCVCQLKSTV